MNINEWANAGWASLTIAALMMQPLPTSAENPKNDGFADQKNLVEIAPKSSAGVARYTRDLKNSPSLAHAQRLALLQQNIKYVFVLFQEKAIQPDPLERHDGWQTLSCVEAWQDGVRDEGSRQERF